MDYLTYLPGLFKAIFQGLIFCYFGIIEILFQGFFETVILRIIRHINVGL